MEKYGETSSFSSSLLADAEYYTLPGLVKRIHDYQSVKVTFGEKEYFLIGKVLGKFPHSL